MLDIEFLKSHNVDIDKSLELFGDIETYNETCKDFLDEIDSKLAELKKYKDANDMENYAVYAHSIKSDARYLGFTELMQVALDHEMAGKSNDQRFVVSEYDNLVNKTNEMIKIVKEYLGMDFETETLDTPISMEKNNVVLIADDSSLVSNFVIKAIQEEYNTIVAKDGKEVIDIISSGKYDIVALLLDLNMPHINGFDVLEFMKQKNLLEKIPVAIITGEDSKDMINKAFEYQIVDMLVKPFNDKDVLKVVEKTVNFYKLPR